MPITPFLARAEVGPMVSGYLVEMAVENTLRDWFTAYLCEAERVHGFTPGLISWPKGWAHSGSDLQKFAPDQLPCFVIMSGGIVDKPIRSAMPATPGNKFAIPSGNLTARFGIEVASIFNAAYSESARADAQLYAVAVRECLLQRPFADLACTVELRAEGYDELDFERTRTYAAAVTSFYITVEDVGWTAGGPPPDAVPPPDPTQPFEPWPQVADTDVTVSKRPLDETPIHEEDQ
jgi:hypothetical protein